MSPEEQQTAPQSSATREDAVDATRVTLAHHMAAGVAQNIVTLLQAPPGTRAAPVVRPHVWASELRNVLTVRPQPTAEVLPSGSERAGQLKLDVDTALSTLASSRFTQVLDRRRKCEQRRLVEAAKRARIEPVSENHEKDDPQYWQRRRKNNEAAKKSRDTRRMKEEEMALQAAFLETENLQLRAQVEMLRKESFALNVLLMERSKRHQNSSS